MSLMKASISNKIYDVISEEEYYRNRHLYYGQYGCVAILLNNGIVYPMKQRYDNTPGAFDNGYVIFYTDPDPRDPNYSSYTKANIIDFNEPKSYKELMQTHQRVVNSERYIITNIENVFQPEIGENDTPEMVALKQAIIDKNIDLDKYEQRFGPNYNNDKRLLKKESITFGKLRAICDALDIKATITFEDAAADTANPIGRVITTELTKKNNEGEE